MKDTPYTRLRLAKEAAEAKPTAETFNRLAEALHQTRYNACTIRTRGRRWCVDLVNQLNDTKPLKTAWGGTFLGDLCTITAFRVGPYKVAGFHPNPTAPQPLDNLKSQA